MVIQPFLAMTAAEMRICSRFPEKIAWMACHFSPYGLGLSNLPKELPPGSLLIVDDITPPHGHDPVLITKQLTKCAESLQCCGILLDFQRQGCEETQAIAKYLTAALPCPTAVSECYAQELDCSIFLPPLPPSVALQAYLTPWKNREVWLELGADGEKITLTEKGAESSILPYSGLEIAGFNDEQLHCHYKIETNENAASFTLWRTKKDFEQLLEEAKTLGVINTVGLYQEIATSLRSSQ